MTEQSELRATFLRGCAGDYIEKLNAIGVENHIPPKLGNLLELGGDVIAFREILVAEVSQEELERVLARCVHLAECLVRDYSK